MAAFNTYIKFLVQVQKTTNLLLTYNNENNTNTDTDNGIKFTLFKDCLEYDVTKIDKKISQNITEITAIVTNTAPTDGKNNYWIDINDENKLKASNSVTGNFKVTISGTATDWESYWTSGKYYSVNNGVGTELNDIYYDNTNNTIININNGVQVNFENNNIIMYNNPGGNISLYRVKKDNNVAVLIEKEYYYFKNTVTKQIYLYVPANNNIYKLAQDGYYKLTNTNTSDTDLSNGLYNISKGELTSLTGTYNLICVNTKNIYMGNGTIKTVQNNTMYICDNKIVLYINNTFSYISFNFIPT